MSIPTLLSERYQIGDTLGYGGMSEVHRGRDTILGRDVAVKVMRSELARDENFYQRFRREAQNSASLNHPSIVAIYDTGEEQTSEGALPFIVMELVEGDTLRDLVRMHGPMDHQRALGVMADVCGALDFSHRKGIIHRDVKPANIMLTADGAVKVMDFGIARAVSASTSALTQTSAVLGTAQYLSPEQARGESVDIRSDVYSAGCVLYEALTGQPPFSGESPVAVVYQHVRETAAVPSSVNPDLDPHSDAVVMMAMAKNPDNRYQSAGEMRTDLLAVLAGQRPAAPLVLRDDQLETHERPEQDTGFRGAGFGAAAGVGAIGSPRLASSDWGLGRVTPDAPTDRHPLPSDDLVSGEQHAAGTGVTRAGRERPVERRDDTVDRRRSRRPLVIAAAALLALAVLAGSAAWLSSGKEDDDPAQEIPAAVEVTIPEVALRPEREVVDQVRSMGLDPVVRTQSDPRIPVGVVVGSDPIAGKRIPRGAQIQVIVSSGKPVLSVPSVLGMAPADAQKALHDAGFEQQARIIEKPSTTDDAGKVIGADPAPGVLVPSDRPLSLTVGTGPEEVSVPGVVGQSLDSARSALQQAGFRVDTVQVDSTRPSGEIVAQSSSAGAQQVKGATITLQVSSGNKFVMPNLVNLTVPQALDTLSKAGWKGTPAQLVQLPQSDPDLTRVGKIFSQQPPVGETGVRDQVVVRVIQFGLIPGPA